MSLYKSNDLQYWMVEGGLRSQKVTFPQPYTGTAIPLISEVKRKQYNYIIIAGHGLVVDHYRETECGLMEQMEPIDENRLYDFNYQQFNILPKTVKVLPVS